MSAKFLWGVVSFPKEGTRIMVIFCTKKFLFVQIFRKHAEVFSESSVQIDEMTLLSDRW
jgi:hypothetical protein